MFGDEGGEERRRRGQDASRLFYPFLTTSCRDCVLLESERSAERGKNGIGPGEMEAVQEHTVGCNAGQLGARESGRQVQDIRNYITQLDAFVFELRRLV